MPRHVHETVDAEYMYDRRSEGMVRKNPAKTRATAIILVAVFLFLAACMGGFWYSYGRLREQAEVVRDLELEAIADLSPSGVSSHADYLGFLKDNLASAQDKTAQARSLTHNGLWSFYSGLVGYHSDIIAFQRMTDTLDSIANTVMTQYTTILDTVEDESLYTADGALDVTPINDAARAVNDMNGALQQAVDSITPSGQIHDRNLYAAYARVADSVGSIMDESSSLLGMFRFLPAFLGANGDRTLIILAQASGRGYAAGGPVESVGWMTARNGRFEIGNFYAAGNWITGAGADDVTEGQARLFNDVAGLRYGQTIAQVTVNPNFPDVARMANDFWKATDFAGAGSDADGVIAFDPYALQQLVGVAGGVTLDDGTKLTGTGTAEFLMHGIYQVVKSDDMPTYYTALVMKVIEAAFADLTMGKVLQISDALISCAGGRHAYLWSFDESDQDTLRSAKLSGEVGGSAAEPVVGVYNEQMHVSHMDWYLNRVSTVERQEDGTYHVSVAFNNTLGTAIGLPASIVGGRGAGAEIGHQLQRVFVYTPDGAQISGVAVASGAKVDTVDLDGRTVYTFLTDISMASTDTVEFDVSCAPEADALTLDLTPSGAGDSQMTVTYSVAGTADAGEDAGAAS